jgi:RNA polymerase sigma-70 factor (ECF subfamily)
VTQPAPLTPWLLAAQAGEPGAFEAIYDSLAPEVTRFVRRLLNDDLSCDDVVQDTFLTLFIHLSDITPPEKLRPYVFRVARNACYDLMRLWGRRPGVSLDDDAAHERIAFSLHDDSAAPDDLTHWLLLGVEVRAAIDRLPEQQRQTLILFCEADLSHAEIAEVMEVSVGTVKSRLFNAKKTLRGLVHPSVLAALQSDGAPPDPAPTQAETDLSEPLMLEKGA